MTRDQQYYQKKIYELLYDIQVLQLQISGSLGGGNSSVLGAFGDLVVAQRQAAAGWRFDYGINTDIVSTTETSGATVTSLESKAQLTTGAAINSTAKVSTKRRLRYLPGIGGVIIFTGVFATPVAGNTQIIGVGDDNDGFFVGYHGTDFGILRRRGGSDYWTSQDEWNQSLDFTPNFQVGNVF